MTIDEKKEFNAVLKDYKDKLNESFAFLESAVNDLKVEEKTTEETAVKIPNNKIILSADIFAEITNVISYAQSNDIINNNLLDRMFKNVQENRKSLTTPTKKDSVEKAELKKNSTEEKVQVKPKATARENKRPYTFADLIAEIDNAMETLR